MTTTSRPFAKRNRDMALARSAWSVVLPSTGAKSIDTAEVMFAITLIRFAWGAAPGATNWKCDGAAPATLSRRSYGTRRASREWRSGSDQAHLVKRLDQAPHDRRALANIIDRRDCSVPVRATPARAGIARDCRRRSS